MKASKLLADFTNAAAGNLVTLLVTRILPIPVAALLANQCGKSGLCEIGSNLLTDTVIEFAFGLAVVGAMMAAKPLMHYLTHKAVPFAAAASLLLAAPHIPAPTPLSIAAPGQTTLTAAPASEPKARLA